MVFVRSRRPTVLLALVTAAVAVALAAATGLRALAGALEQATLLGLAAIFALAFVVRGLRRLWRWPLATIAFFRDAMIVRTGRTELQARWDEVELVTLSESNEWTVAHWPELRLSDRLTVHLRGGPAFRLHPASFGLDPVACRDLVMRLRDDPETRADLPEFDSLLDLTSRRAEVGELMKPRLRL